MYYLVIEDVRVVTVAARGTISRGAVAVRDGKIAAVGAGAEFTGAPARRRIGGGGLTLAPGLVDCHSHLMEYATAGVHRVGPQGQAMAGVANLFLSRCAGMVANGKHHWAIPTWCSRHRPMSTWLPAFPARCGSRRAAAGVDPVATPHGGTGRTPSSPAEIAGVVAAGMRVAIASDAYLPRHPGAEWLEEPAGFEYGPHHLLAIAHPVFRLLREQGRDENEILALVTRNGAAILGLDGGCIERGRPADLVLADGVPGLEVTGPEGIRMVLIDGDLFRDGPGLQG